MNTKLILHPVVTEKSLQLAGTENKYTFVVDRNAHKHQIREAIESMYDVEVLAVNTIKGHRIGKTTGRKRMRTIKAPVKKAVVELKKGQKIDLFEFTQEA